MLRTMWWMKNTSHAMAPRASATATPTPSAGTRGTGPLCTSRSRMMQYTKVPMNSPRVFWLTRSRTKRWRMRVENCVEASESATSRIE